jgi:flagellar basal-body rod protein FlgB
MSTSLEAVTTSLLSLALEATSRRQQAITANVANVHAPGHVPLALSFESQLAQARQALAERGRVQPADLAGVRPQLDLRLDAQGQPVPVQLDLELAEMARNAVHHQALVQGLARHLGVLALAASDGRR